jgi:hypothetical protein
MIVRVPAQQRPIVRAIVEKAQTGKPPMSAFIKRGITNGLTVWKRGGCAVHFKAIGLTYRIRLQPEGGL